MFRRRPDGRRSDISVVVDGRAVIVPAGASAAAAVLAAGFASIRRTGADGGERVPYCMMGACFDCLAEIDGVPNRRSCMLEVRPGMEIRRQAGGHPLDRPIAGERRSKERPPVIELAIVGAGPAGMAAAVLAAELGLDAALIDEQGMPGGQIYRSIERPEPTSPLGRDYRAGQQLAEAFKGSRINYRPGTALWHVAADGTLLLDSAGRAETLTARRVLLATGAMERPVPIPGWALSGVMAVGAAQILLKTADLVPEGRVVLAGQGPLLYLVAAQLVRAGAPPTAVFETAPAENYLNAVRDVAGLWRGRPLLVEVLRQIAALKRAGVPIRRGIRGLRAIGRGRVERVAWDGGELATDHLFLHEGFIPNVQISLALQLRHEWAGEQLCWRPALDVWGQTSLPNIAIAGDAGGIAGAEAAALSGRLAALDAALWLGHISQDDRDRRAGSVGEALVREQGKRRFLDRLHRPSPAVILPSDDEVTACRCEGISLGQIRRAARRGAVDPHQVKAFTRCGMGPCQGRICGPIVSAVIAQELGKPMDEIGPFWPRAPEKPITGIEAAI
jgi:NADPH-dependent 2,4-dienoyl-CoA reductase/sulfur reductase-like enzyme